EDAEEYTTIVIAAGRYVMPRDCILDTHHVTIRGATGNREDVIIDGDQEFDEKCLRLGTRLLSDDVRAPALIKLTRCRHIMFADLTIANSPKYGILFIGDSRVHHLTVHNVKFHNCWARGLKGTGTSRIDHKPCSPEDIGFDLRDDEHIQWSRPRHGIVRHCLFINDHVKRNDDDGFDGDYLAGMDIMGIQDFHVHDNVFMGIRGKNGGARGSIFIWIAAEDVIVENNVFVHCDKAISLGNPSGPVKDVTGGVIRHNTIVGGSNKAIELEHCGKVEVHDNRICSSERSAFHAIQIMAAHDTITIHDNIIQSDPLPAFNIGEDSAQHVQIGENTVANLQGQFADIEIANLSMGED
ncbi:MAG: right-handed parallel beta-helix repeat-containing protein, partial [Planctomycetes bacterium]|nr:right-handed parallel beta-helix repeat-containing protein [Planctomycetota bacterium]